MALRNPTATFKLAKWGLIEPAGPAGEITGYVRTELGEEALNVVRELERKIGEDRGPTSVRRRWGSTHYGCF